MDDGKKSGLQKLVERLVDERLREVLPRIEDVVVQTGLGELLRQEMREKVTRVESQLEAMQREVAALRSSCGNSRSQTFDSTAEQETVRRRMQQVDSVTGQQAQGKIAGIQAGLRGLQRKPSFEVQAAYPPKSKEAPLEGKATEQRSESKSVERCPESKLMEQRSESKSKGITDNLWRMRQMLTEQFNEKSKSPSGQGCIPEAQLERELRELQCITEKEDNSDSMSVSEMRQECNSLLGLVWQPIAGCQDDQPKKDTFADEQPHSVYAEDVEPMEPPSACSTITLFDSRIDSKENGTTSQASTSA